MYGLAAQRINNSNAKRHSGITRTALQKVRRQLHELECTGGIDNNLRLRRSRAIRSQKVVSADRSEGVIEVYSIGLDQ
jgi:hypothetical protein